MNDTTGALAQREIALVDLLDRLLAGGVVITGDLTLRIADVDLVRIDLNALVSSVSSQVPSPFEEFEDCREFEEFAVRERSGKPEDSEELT
ncbi:gas vesicle protein [Streptomyces sp. NPDC051993]|uniref:gas vesicle protein n=1 Tax=Streptomyces sp. NPDC051993 TaxID=3155286 RepID=UPI0034321525